MFPVDRLILIGAVLILVGTVSSKLSARFGLPVLIVFLGLGMLAGSEGIGGVPFEDYQLASGIGTMALALILFDGGLRTQSSALRRVLVPAGLLATLGVVLTAVLIGLAAVPVLGLTPLQGLLLGSIVGSTDAAAVFSVLRTQGVHVQRRIAATLEVESGSNDPMAVFLTIGTLNILLGTMEPGWQLLLFFLQQMIVGAAAGAVVGKLTSRVVNRIHLTAAGLYPVFVAASGLLAYALAANLGGSGFVSVYVAGILIGNSRIVFKRGILLFHDGAAWLAQITMFLMLGLLSFPSRLLVVAPQGLLLTAALIFVARPIAVATVLAPMRFHARDIAFVSWGGLKGAVPIILATYPLLVGVASGPLLFDVVFFVVVVSAGLQGWTLAPVARLLGVVRAPEPDPPVTLEITSVQDIDSDIIEYVVRPNSRAAGRRIRDLALPDGAVVALIARASQVIPPRGSTLLESGDHVFVVVKDEVRRLTDRVFASHGPSSPKVDEMPVLVEFPLRGNATLGDLREFYGIDLDAPDGTTLDEFVRQSLPDGVAVGMSVRVGSIELRVRVIDEGIIERVGLLIASPESDGG